MRLFAATFAAAILAAGAALAGPIDHFFDNTVVVHGADGDALLHFNPDNSFHYTAPDGSMVHGAWDVRDEGLCMIWPDERTSCWPVGPMEPGETATTTSDEGVETRITLREGR